MKICLNPHLQLIIAIFFTINNFSYVELPLICEKMLREQMVEPNMSDLWNICFVLGFHDYKVLDVTNFWRRWLLNSTSWSYGSCQIIKTIISSIKSIEIGVSLAKPSNINEVEWINVIMCYVFIYKMIVEKFEYNCHSQEFSVINLLFSPHVYLMINIIGHLHHEPIMKKKASLMLLEVLILLHFQFWVGLYVHNTYDLF